MFGLHHNTRLSNNDYKDMMRDYNKQYYKTVVEENLIRGGISTRLTDKDNGPRRKIGNHVIKERVYKEEDLNNGKNETTKTS